ncbi:MAG: guanylate kinase [Candidatus Magasanikbacteria bacterium CG_4_9_14_3_um_filter_32_9]|uniref:Guanylate kinase n=1 Tax=Candidatus Magasanikbacteria bacterium CG_4_9_14_3_um_filter_32_9 TaxID=1974644 RepID=A0A2M7Z694_9BACT|nr:MAG: guanylate kinase [Candidatus Magasanikbacteria bacterium CG_4_9_14_3_um_filter_32_9]
MENNKGKIVVISAPSGGGKTTIIKELVKIIPNSTRFVTTTTREKREGEQEAIDYFFISKEEFEKKIENDEFAEYNFHFGNYYGTEKSKLGQFTQKYDFSFLPIETNGKNNLDRLGLEHISIFLLPESLEILRNRIIKRGEHTAKEIVERLGKVKSEIKESEKYNFKVVNKEGHLEETIQKIVDFLENRI